MKELLNSDQYRLVFPILQSALQKQVKAVESYGTQIEQNPELRRLLPYDYYKGNVGFMKWLMWFLNPDKPQRITSRGKNRNVNPPTTSGGVDSILQKDRNDHSGVA